MSKVKTKEKRVQLRVNILPETLQKLQELSEETLRTERHVVDLAIARLYEETKKEPIEAVTYPYPKGPLATSVVNPPFPPGQLVKKGL